jgi:hypothetical protein
MLSKALSNLLQGEVDQFVKLLEHHSQHCTVGASQSPLKQFILDKLVYHTLRSGYQGKLSFTYFHILFICCIVVFRNQMAQFKPFHKLGCGAQESVYGV